MVSDLFERFYVVYNPLIENNFITWPYKRDQIHATKIFMTNLIVAHLVNFPCFMEPDGLPILSYVDQVHICTQYFFKIHFNIIIC